MTSIPIRGFASLWYKRMSEMSGALLGSWTPKLGLRVLKAVERHGVLVPQHAALQAEVEVRRRRLAVFRLDFE